MSTPNGIRSASNMLVHNSFIPKIFKTSEHFSVNIRGLKNKDKYGLGRFLTDILPIDNDLKYFEIAVTMLFSVKLHIFYRTPKTK